MSQPLLWFLTQQCISFVLMWKCCITPSFQHGTSSEYIYSVCSSDSFCATSDHVTTYSFSVLQVTMSLHIHSVCYKWPCHYIFIQCVTSDHVTIYNSKLHYNQCYHEGTIQCVISVITSFNIMCVQGNQLTNSAVLST